MLVCIGCSALRDMLDTASTEYQYSCTTRFSYKLYVTVIMYVLSPDRKAHYTHAVRSVTGPEGTLHTRCTFCHRTGRHITHTLYVLSPDRKAHYTCCTFCHRAGRHITHMLYVLSPDWKARNITVQRPTIRFFSSPVTIYCWLNCTMRHPSSDMLMLQGTIHMNMTHHE